MRGAAFVTDIRESRSDRISWIYAIERAYVSIENLSIDEAPQRRLASLERDT
jgi:hypothetical protein